jgi:hypothetical protein
VTNGAVMRAALLHRFTEPLYPEKTDGCHEDFMKRLSNKV